MTNARWSACGARRLHQDVAVGAVDLQSVPLDCLEVSPACNEMHLLTAGGELGSEISADTAGAHDRDLHGHDGSGFTDGLPAALMFNPRWPSLDRYESFRDPSEQMNLAERLPSGAAQRAAARMADIEPFHVMQI